MSSTDRALAAMMNTPIQPVHPDWYPRPVSISDPVNYREPMPIVTRQRKNGSGDGGTASQPACLSPKGKPGGGGAAKQFTTGSEAGLIAA